MQRPPAGDTLGLFEKQQENQWAYSQMSKWHGEMAKFQIVGDGKNFGIYSSCEGKLLKD